jgi:hypothetical protein
MLAKLLEKLKVMSSSVEPFLDMLVAVGLFRHSKRQNKKTINEKVAPRWAISSWHKSRNAQLLTQIDAGDSLIIAIWMNGLEEPQQHHWIVSIANMSYGENAAEEATNKAAAIALYKQMAGLPDDSARTAMADSLDFIKDPVDEYLLVKLEREAKRQFTDSNALILWAATKGKNLLVDRVNTINTAIGTPATATTPATGLVAKSDDFLTRMRAKHAASKR